MNLEFSNKAPKEFPSILGNLVKEILKNNPQDIELFCLDFFQNYDENLPKYTSYDFDMDLLNKKRNYSAQTNLSTQFSNY